MMESIAVTVNILERSYKLTIAPEEERFLREAAAFINAQALLFKKQYGQRDNQDLLAMVALAKVTELIKSQNSLKYKDNELSDKLTEIDDVLEKSLRQTRNSL